MRAISRREFVTGASTVLGGIVFSGERMLHANPLGLPIGCQTWPVRTMIAGDFPGTLKQLAAAGFQSIEMCSPVGYADSGFGGLRKYSGSEIRKRLPCPPGAGPNATCPSSRATRSRSPSKPYPLARGA